MTRRPDPDTVAYLRVAGSTGAGMLALSVAAMHYRTWPVAVVAPLTVVAILAAIAPLGAEILGRDRRRFIETRLRSLRGWMILERSDALDVADDPATSTADRIVALARADALLAACRQCYTTFGEDPPADLVRRRRPGRRRR